MKLYKEDLRAWDQESIDNQKALASIAKEIKKLFDDSGDVNYATIDYDIFDYGNEIVIKDVYDPDDIGNFIEDELGFRFRVKDTKHGYGDVYVDTTQEYEDEYGDIYTRVSREYLEENIKFSDEPEVEYKGYIISPFTLKDMKVGNKSIGDCTKYSIKKGDAYYKDKEFTSVEDVKKFIDSQLNESKNIIASIYDKEGNLIETKHFSSRKQLDDYVDTLNNLIDMTADTNTLYKNKKGQLGTQDVWKIIIDTTITEAKKKKEQGYFVKYNTGNPEQNQAIFNKNMTPNVSGESSGQGLGEEYLSTMQGLKEFAEMTKNEELYNNVNSQLKLDKEKNESLGDTTNNTTINIKKELNDIDWENDLALSDMYYSMDLSDEEKKEIARLINERDIDRLKNYIENLYKKSVDLDIEENEILSELNDILAIASKGSFEVKEESDKNTVIGMLKKKGFKLEVSGNDNGYHIEYWKEEI